MGSLLIIDRLHFRPTGSKEGILIN